MYEFQYKSIVITMLLFGEKNVGYTIVVVVVCLKIFHNRTDIYPLDIIQCVEKKKFNENRNIQNERQNFNSIKITKLWVKMKKNVRSK